MVKFHESIPWIMLVKCQSSQGCFHRTKLSLPRYVTYEERACNLAWYAQKSLSYILHVCSGTYTSVELVLELRHEPQCLYIKRQKSLDVCCSQCLFYFWQFLCKIILCVITAYIFTSVSWHLPSIMTSSRLNVPQRPRLYWRSIGWASSMGESKWPVLLMAVL